MTPDWSNSESMISRHFSVHESLWLPVWRREATEADGLDDQVKAQIVRLAEKLDVVRDRIEVSIVVHNWFRPFKYNRECGGAPASGHMCLGPWSAVDFSAALPGTSSRGQSCDRLRAMILPWLEELDLRLENNGPEAPWVHLDTKPVVLSRYFRS
jgi:hypothetical protein